MVLAAIQDVVSENNLVPTPPTEQPLQQEQHIPPQQQANATTQDNVIPLLVQQMQSMQEMMKAI